MVLLGSRTIEVTKVTQPSDCQSVIQDYMYVVFDTKPQHYRYGSKFYGNLIIGLEKIFRNFRSGAANGGAGGPGPH